MLARRLYIHDPKEKRASLTTILCHRSCRDQLHHTRPLRHNHDPYPVLLLQQSKCLNWWGALISLKHATIMEDCKWCSEGFLVSFTHFTNLSFPHGEYLSEWKFANAIPLFENDNRKLKENYRPVSMVPFFF